jgi:Uma2 family endonuclease
MPIATSPRISLRKYLRKVYRPDRDFVDGNTERRHVGELDHGRAQVLLATSLYNNEGPSKVIILLGQRVRVSATCVRVADLCILRTDAPYEPVIQTPPLLCIDILSPKDRLSQTLRRLEDYLQMGVENLWVIDPRDRTAFTYTEAGLLKLVGDRFTIPGAPNYVDLPSLFAKLPPKP